MTALPIEGPHWSFALRLYAKAGVSEACLVLQDRMGVDVNVLLFALFAAMDRCVALDERDLQAIDDQVASWRDEVVLPLRSIRRRLKSGPEPAPDVATEALRDKVKRSEIAAEQIEQAIMARWFEGCYREHKPRDVNSGDVICRVVNHFAARSGTSAGITDPEIQEAMRIVLEAAQTIR